MSLDDGFRQFIKLGNNTRMTVMGRGTVRMEVKGVIQVITQVYYISELKNNLLGIGQLQEKGIAILIPNNLCKLFHCSRRLIMQGEMTTNRMFVLLASINSKEHDHACFKTVTENDMELWHYQMGHLNYKGLRTLHQRNMMKGLPL